MVYVLATEPIAADMELVVEGIAKRSTKGGA
jgi:hypothetical protein